MTHSRRLARRGGGKYAYGKYFYAPRATVAFIALMQGGLIGAVVRYFGDIDQALMAIT